MGRTITKAQEDEIKRELEEELGKIGDASFELMTKKGKELIAKHAQPDYTNLERLYGSGEKTVGAFGAGRTSPGWERQYAEMRFPEELAKWRNPQHDFETLEWLRALIEGDQALIREIMARPHNRQHAAEWSRADLATGAAAAGTGGGLVPAGFANSVSIMMRQTARLRNYVTIFNGSEYNRKIPTQTASTVGAVFAEAADMTGGVTEPTYGSVTPEPVKIGCVIKFSRELIDDSPLALVNLVSKDCADSIGILEDTEILDGSNFTATLHGDLTPEVSPNWDDDGETLATLATKVYVLGQAYRGRASWIINEDAAAYLSGLAATDGRPLFLPFGPAPSYIDDQGGFGTLMGRPCIVVPVAMGTANEAIYGDLSAYALYVREALRAEVSRDQDFDTDQVALKVARRCDGAIMQASAIKLFDVS